MAKLKELFWPEVPGLGRDSVLGREAARRVAGLALAALVLGIAATGAWRLMDAVSFADIDPEVVLERVLGFVKSVAGGIVALELFITRNHLQFAPFVVVGLFLFLTQLRCTIGVHELLRNRDFSESARVQAKRLNDTAERLQAWYFSTGIGMAAGALFVGLCKLWLDVTIDPVTTIGSALAIAFAGPSIFGLAWLALPKAVRHTVKALPNRFDDALSDLYRRYRYMARDA